MTNNQMCNFLGGLGCAISFVGMVILFFGVTLGAVATVIGMIIAFLGLVNYD